MQLYYIFYDQHTSLLISFCFLIWGSCNWSAFVLELLNGFYVELFSICYACEFLVKQTLAFISYVICCFSFVCMKKVCCFSPEMHYFTLYWSTFNLLSLRVFPTLIPLTVIPGIEQLGTCPAGIFTWKNLFWTIFSRL